MAKRGKRLFPRRMASDFINAYKGVDQNLVQAHEFLNNRSRVRTTKGSRSDMEPVQNNTFTREVPETVNHHYYGVPENLDPNEYIQGGKKHVVVKRADMDARESSPSETNEEWRQASLNKAWIPTPRKAALIRARGTKPGELLLHIYASWKGLRHSRVVEFQQKVITEYKDFKVTLHFAGEEFIFVQETADMRWISETYGSYLGAMKMYNTKQISWIIQKPK